MKKLLLLLLFFCTPAMAADWYLSDCSGAGHTTGCYDNSSMGNAACDDAGTTTTNPICPDFDGDATVEFLNVLLDNVNNSDNPEASANDTINLCTGTCDGSGSGATITVDETVIPNPAGPMTITGFAGEGTIVMDGGGLVAAAINNTQGVTDYTWQNFNVAHYDDNGCSSNCRALFIGYGSDSDGWHVENMDFGYLGLIQTDVGIGDVVNCAADSSNYDAYGMFVTGAARGDMTWNNITMHHICKFAFRVIGANDASVTTTITNSEFYNMDKVNNDQITQNQTWTNNTIWDTNGLAFERDFSNIVVEDNTIECRGTYHINKTDCTDCGGATDPIGCQYAMNFTFGGATESIWNVRIRRNTIFGKEDEESLQGSLLHGINFTSDCGTDCTSIDTIIENNMMYQVADNFSGPSIAHGSLEVVSDEAVVVQNNTVYNATYPLQLDGAAHTIRNNLLGPSNDNRSGDYAEIWTTAAASGSTLLNNNTYDTIGDVINLNGTAYSCAEVNAGDAGATNICQSSSFVNTGGASNTWDFHITAATDDGNCASGATEDIDKGSRPSTCDIGADEYGSPASSAPTLDGGAMTGGAITLLQLKEWSCEMQKKHGVGACIP